ncbi:hypothetical protein [Holdemanella sp.]|uniref:hypothetical protein n=1 Tax=Holdemanella sp. TaxID=1971762 RepID=UPI003AEF26D5
MTEKQKYDDSEDLTVFRVNVVHTKYALKVEHEGMVDKSKTARALMMSEFDLDKALDNAASAFEAVLKEEILKRMRGPSND